MFVDTWCYLFLSLSSGYDILQRNRFVRTLSVLVGIDGKEKVGSLGCFYKLLGLGTVLAYSKLLPLDFRKRAL